MSDKKKREHLIPVESTLDEVEVEIQNWCEEQDEEESDIRYLYETLKDIESKEGLHIEVLTEVIRDIEAAAKRNEKLDIRQYVMNGMVEWDL